MSTDASDPTKQHEGPVGFDMSDAQYEADRKAGTYARRTDMCYSLDELSIECYNISKAHGFWEDLPRNKGEMIALMHSELSECLEGVRKPGPDNHLPHLPSEVVELADCIIRILDYAAGHNLPIGRAVFEKMRFNESRPYKHGKKF